MNLIALAACFLFFCHVPHKQHVAKSRSCEQITKGFDSWANRDDWVSGFPVDQQHRALVCLDRLEQRQGK